MDIQSINAMTSNGFLAVKVKEFEFSRDEQEVAFFYLKGKVLEAPENIKGFFVTFKDGSFYYQPVSDNTEIAVNPKKNKYEIVVNHVSEDFSCEIFSSLVDGFLEHLRDITGEDKA